MKHVCFCCIYLVSYHHSTTTTAQEHKTGEEKEEERGEETGEQQKGDSQGNPRNCTLREAIHTHLATLIGYMPIRFTTHPPTRLSENRGNKKIRFNFSFGPETCPGTPDMSRNCRNGTGNAEHAPGTPNPWFPRASSAIPQVTSENIVHWLVT